jgi:ferredoxin-NADP reductase
MKLILKEKQPVIENVESFIFEPDQSFSWQPGQYLHYDFPHQSEDDRGEERYFTNSAAPFEGHIQITTRFDPQHSSSFKHALKNLKIGDSITADGPKGEFTIDDLSKKYVLIAGGIGITPYRSQLVQLDHDGKELNADLLYANRDQNLVFGDELRALEAKHPDFHIKTYIGDKKISKEELAEYATDPQTVFYISGPRPMVETYQHVLADDIGVPEDRVKTDYFPGYQLG